VFRTDEVPYKRFRVQRFRGSWFCEFGERFGGEVLDFGFKKRQMSRKTFFPKLRELIDIQALAGEDKPPVKAPAEEALPKK
jgi:hypothetical protein